MTETRQSAAARMVRARATAATIRERAPAFGDRLTSPDPPTGEAWDRGQVLSHMAEFLPYWIEQVDAITAAGGNNHPFGRLHTTQSRLDRIEAGRHEDLDDLLGRIDDGLVLMEGLLARLSPEELELVGLHPRRGEMTVSAIIDKFLLDHLEEHADQLSG